MARQRKAPPSGKQIKSGARPSTLLGHGFHHAIEEEIRRRIAGSPGGHLIAARLDNLSLRLEVNLNDPEGGAEKLAGVLEETIARYVEDAIEDISKITGQKPSISYSRKSVATFKVREGEAVGARVTLRGNHMWEFLDRFINITAPNIRDFRGISPKSFDGRGNYAYGVNDQSIFPEIELDKIKRQLGFDLIFVTSANTDDEGRALLKALGMPYRETKKAGDDAAASEEGEVSLVPVPGGVGVGVSF